MLLDWLWAMLWHTAPSFPQLGLQLNYCPAEQLKGAASLFKVTLLVGLEGEDLHALTGHCEARRDTSEGPLQCQRPL